MKKGIFLSRITGNAERPVFDYIKEVDRNTFKSID